MLQFSKKLYTLRKEQRLTQQQLALHVGVSKAAVSKWETGLSYPDILVSTTGLTQYFPSMRHSNGLRKQKICPLTSGIV